MNDYCKAVMKTYGSIYGYLNVVTEFSTWCNYTDDIENGNFDAAAALEAMSSVR